MPLLSLAAPNALDGLRKGYAQPSPDARMMVRWWWFGSAVTPAGLERELKAMKAAGIGGVEIQPVYPLSLDKPAQGIRNLPFLSPEFLASLTFVANKGRELGLRVDLTLGSGWPYGGPYITRELAASRLRVDRTFNPLALKAGERVLAEFAEPGLRFIESHTGQAVKRASLGAEGPVLDHYSRAAIDLHMKMAGEPLLKAFGEHPPYSIFCDSLEAFGSDWTPNLLAEFEKRRGYDLKPHLPALTGELTVEKGSIRNDWGLTLTELAEENFLAPLQAWAHGHGTKFRVQAYGTPPVTLASSRFADLNDGEQTQWKALSSARWASSANHAQGRIVTSSETWTWLHSPAFAATPLDIKAEADIHFIQGINQLIGHGWPSTPAAVEKPGWALYAAAVLNDSNPWWGAMPDVTAYLQRMSWLLRQGRPVADVALYVPVADIRARFTAGSGRVSIDRQALEVMGPEVIPALLKAGYNFDFVDDGLLDEALRRGGYKAILLPHVERIPLASLKRIQRFAGAGGLVLAIGRRPERAPGYLDQDKQNTEIQAAVGQLNLVADEGVAIGKLSSALKPDVRWLPESAAIGYAHRALDGADVYFVANTANVAYRGKLAFRAGVRKAELWDPLGVRRTAFQGEIELAPYGSAVIVVSDAASAPVAKPASGKELDLSRGWDVEFLDGGRKVRMDELRNWCEDQATRYYSGVAAYEKEIEVEAGMVKAELDFGPSRPVEQGSRRQNGMRAWIEAPVRDAAVVFVNGKRAGAVFAPPYRLDLTGYLKPGKNLLRIEVGNTNLNLMARKGEPDYRDVTASYGDRFQMQDMRHMLPEASGLVGRIRLIAR
jgi:hypothetical protein